MIVKYLSLFFSHTFKKNVWSVLCNGGRSKWQGAQEPQTALQFDQGEHTAKGHKRRSELASMGKEVRKNWMDEKVIREVLRSFGEGCVLYMLLYNILQENLVE